MQTPQPVQGIVIGGGITGLAAAHRCLELSRERPSPLNVLLLEASDRLGGVIRTVEYNGCLLEAGPDSFVNEQPWGMQLCQRLGLAEELVPANPQHRQSFVVRRGRLLPVPEGFYLLGPARLGPFLRSPLVSPVGKLRAGCDLVLPRRCGADDESVAAFVRRRFGREVLERLAEPLIGGMASGDVEYLSMAAVLPHVVAMEREHGSIIRALRRRRLTGAQQDSSGARYGLFVSFRRGMQTLVDRVASRLPAPSLRLRARVTSLARSADGQWRLTLADGETLTTGAVCLAVPPHHAAALVRSFDPALAALLERPSYASWITINLAYRRADITHPLDGFGFVVPRTERLPMVGCTFSHVKFSGRVPEGTALLRAFIRVDDDAAPLQACSDERLAEDAHQTLVPLLGIAAAPRFATVHRALRALPQYAVGHLDWVADVRRAAHASPGLALAGNAFSGHGITQCIRSGETAAEQLVGGLAQSRV